MPGIKELYRKSYLFEIVDKNNPSVIVEAFTLIIPPDNIEIEEPQRVTRTKTFGGVFIDDMGPDIMPIRISGSTGGSTVRRTFIPSSVTSPQSTQDFNGKTSFYHFRNTIMRYKDNKTRKDTFFNFEIHLYDLSVIPEDVTLASADIENIAEGYVVSLEKFKMTRSKEKPLFYNYSIEMVALRKMGSPTNIYKAPVVPADVFSLLGTIRRGLRTVQSYFTDIKNVFDQIEDVFDLVDDLDEKLASFVNQTANLVVFPSELARRLLISVKTLGLAVEGSFYDAVTLMGKQEDEFNQVLLATREIEYSSSSLVVFSKTPNSVGSVVKKLNIEPSTTQSGLTRYEGVTEVEAELTDNMLNISTEDIVTYIIYGYFIVIATSATTLEGLALNYYGNASQAYLIADFNNFTSHDDINVGDQIQIPVLTRGASAENNFIYTLVIRDVYGSDIKLDNNKIVIAASGDFSRIEGTNNLIQAINLRLGEKLGNRLRLTLYGIKDSVGSAMTNSAPLSYAITSLKDTLLQDPRIVEIDNIKIRGTGDIVYMSFNIQTIKIGDVIPFTGDV